MLNEITDKSRFVEKGPYYAASTRNYTVTATLMDDFQAETNTLEEFNVL